MDRDARIFPGHYAPVMVMDNGKRVVKPMRYQCRPAGKPALHDVKFSGTVVLEFRPRPAQDMLVACLWSHWSGAGEPDLLSFAAITDEPPPEIAAAGHDRCIIAIQPSNVDAWLNPDPGDLAAQHAILEDRAIAFYEHQLAA